MSISQTYRKTIENRVSRFVLQPDTVPSPPTLKNDIKVLLNALRESEAKVAELTERIEAHLDHAFKEIPESPSTQFEGGKL